MRILEYLEIQNLKCFGEKQRIELDHPTVLIGPNNCGKTTTIQAIALWSQAIKEWHRSKGNAPPKKRTSTSINRLKIVSVPVQRTRYFWHKTNVRSGNKDIPLIITVGICYEGRVEPITMQFRNHGEDLIYCMPDQETLLRPRIIKYAASLNVELLYPMSGLETEEPILQPGRIDVLMGQGRTAEVLRNLCLMVHGNSQEKWGEIYNFMKRLFKIDLEVPQETSRGNIDLYYRQDGVKERLDISLSGRGQQQMLLILAYLYSHPQSVLMIDEPDAHLEILRQKQIYVLLREIASANSSQVILVTHSEVILEEVDQNRGLTLLMDGKVDFGPRKKDIRNALKYFGTEHYVRAKQCGHVLYIEGSTDLASLRALARHLRHPVSDFLDERVNVYYVKNNFPRQTLDSKIEKVEGSHGMTPKDHFFALRSVIPNLVGLAILDSDAKNQADFHEGGLDIVHWRRYECENYYINPEVLRRFTMQKYKEYSLLINVIEDEISKVIDRVMLVYVFRGSVENLRTWKDLSPEGKRLLWESKTENIKLSRFAEEYFRKLAERLDLMELIGKKDLYEVVAFTDPQLIPGEVVEKLDLIYQLLSEKSVMYTME